MSSNSSPKFLVKATFNKKIKIFQLPTTNMETLWACVRRAFDIGDHVPQSAFQGQYLDKDGESIFVDTDEELMLAFAICDQPLRLNVLFCSEDQGSNEPVAFPVGPDTMESLPSSFEDEAGVVSATKVKDWESSDDSSSSDVTDNDDDAGAWTESNPRLFADAESSLKDAGVSVASADLQSFMQLLQLPTSRLRHVTGASDKERVKAVKKMSKIVAKCHRRHAVLIAKYGKIKDKEQRRKNKVDVKAKTHDASSSEQGYDAFGDWWVMEDALPAAQSGECSGRRMKIRKRMLWPLFWRHALLKRGVDIDAVIIRQLCAILKIRKGRLFHLGLASRKDLPAFCSNPSAESWISSLPNPMAEECAHGGKGWKGKGKGRGRGGSWRRMGRGGGAHHEWDEFDFDFEDDPFHKGKGKGFWEWKGKGKMHGWKGKGRGGLGFGGHPDECYDEFGEVFDDGDHWHHFGKGKGKDMMMWHMKGKGKGHRMEWMGKGCPSRGKGQVHGDDSESFARDNGRMAPWQAGRRCGGRGDGSRAWGEESGEGGKCLVRFVAHTTIPDGTVVEPGSHFLKIWSVRNDGNQPWPVECELVTVGGGGGKGKGKGGDEDRGMAVNADGTCTKLVRGAAFRVPHSATKPGQEVSIALDVRAPSKPGLYQVFFRVRDAAHGKKFGQRLWFSIMVKANINAMDGFNPVGPIGSRKLD